MIKTKNYKMEKVLQEDILHIDLNIERNKKIPNSN